LPASISGLSPCNPNPCFSPPAPKLTRAGQILQELEANPDSYRDSNPITASFVPNTNPPAIDVHYAAVPQSAEAIIGDCVHNMRTAPDLMASELVRLNGGNDKDVCFPFAASGNKLEEAIKSRNFHKAGQGAVDLLKSFAPYRGGNENLRGLHDLDDPALRHVTVTEADIDYIFPEDGIFPGRNVIQTLKDLMQLVDGIIEAFARLVELRLAKP
jgi:hypothetical protein